MCTGMHTKICVRHCSTTQLCALQWLIYNDCLFRWRHTYEYILFVDRDEFLHFPGKPAGEVRAAPTDILTCLSITVDVQSYSAHQLKRVIAAGQWDS